MDRKGRHSLQRNLAALRLLGIGAAAVLLSPLHATPASSSPSELPYELLIPGHYSTGELPRDAEGTWFALTWSEHGSSFEPVQVRLQPAKNPNATGDLTLPGAIVPTSHPDSIIFLVRGAGLDTSGSAATWSLREFRLTDGERRRLGPDERWVFTRSDTVVHTRAPAESPGGPDREYEDQFVRIWVLDKMSGTRQKLGEWYYLSPAVHWAGDLDGDGGLDLLLFDDTSETGSRAWTLFRSTGLAGTLFRSVARFHLPGC